ncbi:MAG: hypothetical protein H6922_04495 [Pseudomonadaceae bacterium]|nr:hypothetical protein [Pseudomonadaceae bacterium]
MPAITTCLLSEYDMSGVFKPLWATLQAEDPQTLEYMQEYIGAKGLNDVLEDLQDSFEHEALSAERHEGYLYRIQKLPPFPQNDWDKFGLVMDAIMGSAQSFSFAGPGENALFMIDASGEDTMEDLKYRCDMVNGYLCNTHENEADTAYELMTNCTAVYDEDMTKEAFAAFQHELAQALVFLRTQIGGRPLVYDMRPIWLKCWVGAPVQDIQGNDNNRNRPGERA